MYVVLSMLKLRRSMPMEMTKGRLPRDSCPCLYCHQVFQNRLASMCCLASLIGFTVHLRTSKIAHCSFPHIKLIRSGCIIAVDLQSCYSRYSRVVPQRCVTSKTSMCHRALLFDRHGFNQGGHGSVLKTFNGPRPHIHLSKIKAFSFSV